MSMKDNFSFPVDQFAKAHGNAVNTLLGERESGGYWIGELSTSALSTATAIVALGSVDSAKYHSEIEAAVAWLAWNQNEDGGWGDTTRSFSNISTTLLCWSALVRFGNSETQSAERAGREWVREYVGTLDAGRIAETVKARYGKDRTFSVPILMLCAICGTLGDNGWKWVLRLPFELAWFPRTWFAAMRLPVVSYALPALIAIGYARYQQCRIRKEGKRWSFFWPRISALLEEIQPSSGGFLEAAPLTSFVTMALVAAGEENHPVVTRSVDFLLDSVRDDGSWPIDTNLATWSTTLSVKALSSPSQEGWVKNLTLFDSAPDVLDWLLGQQYRIRHPFTDSPPGGWAWTDLPGGVPDADDTPGALLALSHLRSERRKEEILASATSGIRWLLDIQNRDGGIPTFCRGWGALPFDRSSPDLTAHTLRALQSWFPELPRLMQQEVAQAQDRALQYLRREQRDNGSWVPLWFGNQHRLRDEENPTYGTSMVIRALDELGSFPEADHGAKWLLESQNKDGGWGSGRDETPSTVEETSLAISALAFRCEASGAVSRGVVWLLEETKDGHEFEAAPIGFYFARLWYFERSYPIIWATEAFNRVKAAIDSTGE